MYKIKVATDFTQTPGARHIEDGAYPGDEFRDKILLPQYLEAVANNQKLIIDLDGCYGYATSFLEESFGGMVRKLKKKGIMNNIEIISKEDESLKELICNYVKEEESRI